jgi:hypothetical protein
MGWGFVLVFTAGRFDRKIASLFALDQLYIFVFDINNGWFFIFAKKVILFIILHSSKWLDWTVIKIYWAQICIAFVSIFKVFFKEQIVSSGYVVVFIGFNTSFCVFDVKVEIL